MNQADFDKKLRKAYEITARIVRDYGEPYLPVFERLHLEIKDRDNKYKLLNLARNVASEQADI